MTCADHFFFFWILWNNEHGFQPSQINTETAIAQCQSLSTVGLTTARRSPIKPLCCGIWLIFLTPSRILSWSLTNLHDALEGPRLSWSERYSLAPSHAFVDSTRCMLGHAVPSRHHVAAALSSSSFSSPPLTHSSWFLFLPFPFSSTSSQWHANLIS